MRDINSLNRVLLIGRLGKNPELRYIPQSEQAVTNFTLATNERLFNPSTNESDIRVEWHRIVAWGKLAEFCERYLTKGKQILVEGKIRTRSWQDKDGNKRFTTEIHAQNIILLGKKEETDQGDQFGEKSVSEFPGDNEAVKDGEGEEEVPF